MRSHEVPHGIAGGVLDTTAEIQTVASSLLYNSVDATPGSLKEAHEVWPA
jgi:hypothetical protein